MHDLTFPTLGGGLQSLRCGWGADSGGGRNRGEGAYREGKEGSGRKLDGLWLSVGGHDRVGRSGGGRANHSNCHRPFQSTRVRRRSPYRLSSFAPG